MLRLSREKGDLDLAVCYMPTGVARELQQDVAQACPSTPIRPGSFPAAFRAQREALCRRIPPLLRPDQALMLLAGDLNFVITLRDALRGR